MKLINRTLSVFRRITIVIAIAAAFLFGLATTVYLSLRSPEVTVPDVVGKDRFAAENILGGAGLNFRVRATRPSNQVKADIVLFQLPRAGEVVKAGQTVAMDISRATKEGESSEAITSPAQPEEKKSEDLNANANSDENKPKRSQNTNKNGNENGNLNLNRNANADHSDNRNANENNSGVKESKSNENTNGNANAPSGSNENRINQDRRTNSNDSGNRRPAPRPSPAALNNNRDND